METQTRKKDLKAFYLLSAMLALVVAGGAYLGRRHGLAARSDVQARIRTWHTNPRLMTELMMERYGPPNELTPKAATWHDQGRWKRITVRGDAPEDCLEQTIGYRMPPEAVSSLRRLRGVRADPAKDELSAVSGSEALNFLALNVADEVVTGKRSAADALNFYEITAKLSAAGKSSPYLEDLLFKPYAPVPERDWRREIGY